MKITARSLFFIFLAGLPLFAQQNTADPVAVLRAPGWNKGIFVGGSQSFANSFSAQTALAGVRVGKVLSHQHGSNALRGSFEAAIDIIPINEFWISGHPQYAAAINPLIGKWNFTAGKTLSPYIAAVGGIVFSPSNLPPGDTSQVNFTSGAELGAQWFLSSKNSINFAMKIYHLSNASIGNLNPGINGAVQAMAGYTWH